MAAKNSNNHWIISANDLLSGQVVYLCSQDQWTTHLQSALVCSSKLNKTLLDSAEACADQIVGAQAVPVILNNEGVLQLITLRDRLRESGPSHRVAQQPAQGAQYV